MGVTQEQGRATREPTRMSRDACWSLLRLEYVGRLGYVLDDRPVIVPVNYRVTPEGQIVIASRAGAKLEVAKAGGLLCLQVDGTQELRHAGWSVLATGRADVIEGEEARRVMRRANLRPWAADADEVAVLWITPVLLEGRRVRRWSSPTTGTDLL